MDVSPCLSGTAISESSTRMFPTVQPGQAVTPHKSGRSEDLTRVQNGIITPPMTPKMDDVERKRSSISVDSQRLMEDPSEHLKAMLSVGVGLGVNPKEMVERWIENGDDLGPLPHVPEIARPYKKEYQLIEELGYGAWSTVYSAVENSSSSQLHTKTILTPPATPERRPKDSVCNQLLAVKRLSRRDGREVIEKEARILTYLSSHNHSILCLVPFHGFDSKRSSIIMTAIPLTLEEHAKSAAKLPLTTSTMFDPVTGAVDWINIACSLISGLKFLHEKACVHGDIKPANILLQQETHGENVMLKPLYCDFSSSRICDASVPPDNADEQINAVSTAYTAPELLEAMHPSNHNTDKGCAVATVTSDVFSLGVTLLFAAIGESPYAGAQMELQKAGMAREGRPLEYARCGGQASRVMKGKTVDIALKQALDKNPANRVQVERWEVMMNQ